MEIIKAKKLAIVGGGVSGIVSCKLASEMGFEVKLFEKDSDLLGNWKRESKVWSHLITNISKYYTQFSDFIWSDISNIFPNKSELNKFLENYVKQFQINKYCELNINVVNIKLIEKNRFMISYLKQGILLTEEFDFILICSGNYAIPNIPNINFGDFEVIHSSEYKKPELFRGKKILVIGNGHSGCEISAEVCKTASLLVNVFKEKAWIMPKFIFSKQFKKYLPYDLASLSLNKIELIHSLTMETYNKLKNTNMALTTQQNMIHKDLYIDPESPHNYTTSISSEYLDCVKNGLIIPEHTHVKNIEGKKVFLDNGKSYEFDTIILCTGYKRDLSFLDNKLKENIFVENSNEVKSNLIFDIFHPEINLAFVGISIGVFFLRELEAKIALKKFLNILDYKNRNINFSILGDNPLVRFVLLSKILGIFPDIDLIEKEDPELFDYVMNGPMIPQIFGLKDSNSKLARFNIQYIKKLNRDIQRDFMISKY